MEGLTVNTAEGEWSEMDCQKHELLLLVYGYLYKGYKDVANQLYQNSALLHVKFVPPKQPSLEEVYGEWNTWKKRQDRRKSTPTKLCKDTDTDDESSLDEEESLSDHNMDLSLFHDKYHARPSKRKGHARRSAVLDLAKTQVKEHKPIRKYTPPKKGAIKKQKPSNKPRQVIMVSSSGEDDPPGDNQVYDPMEHRSRRERFRSRISKRMHRSKGSSGRYSMRRFEASEAATNGEGSSLGRYWREKDGDADATSSESDIFDSEDSYQSSASDSGSSRAEGRRADKQKKQGKKKRRLEADGEEVRRKKPRSNKNKSDAEESDTDSSVNDREPVRVTKPRGRQPRKDRSASTGMRKCTVRLEKVSPDTAHRSPGRTRKTATAKKPDQSRGETTAKRSSGRPKKATGRAAGRSAETMDEATEKAPPGRPGRKNKKKTAGRRR